MMHEIPLYSYPSRNSHVASASISRSNREITLTGCAPKIFPSLKFAELQLPALRTRFEYKIASLKIQGSPFYENVKTIVEYISILRFNHATLVNFVKIHKCERNKSVTKMETIERVLSTHLPTDFYTHTFQTIPSLIIFNNFYYP